jgi:hypothetical protein
MIDRVRELRISTESADTCNMKTSPKAMRGTKQICGRLVLIYMQYHIQIMIVKRTHQLILRIIEYLQRKPSNAYLVQLAMTETQNGPSIEGKKRYTPRYAFCKLPKEPNILLFNIRTVSQILSSIDLLLLPSPRNCISINAHASPNMSATPANPGLVPLTITFSG